MMALIVSSGVLVLLIAGGLLVAGLRGRLVNTHPHCRGCGFDLDGLDLGSGSRCPECGRILTTSRAAIRIGKRKPRKSVVVLGSLLLLLGGAGAGWPMISQIPSVKNFNWYEHLPESMLVRLANQGSTKALDTLHDRLIPGEVSDKALASLVDHTMKLLDDESTPWDERWGDVLLYAFMLDKMDQPDAFSYLEHAFTLSLDMNDEVGVSVDTIAYMGNFASGARGTHQYGFRFQLQQSGITGGSGTPYQYTIHSYTPRMQGDTEPDPKRWSARSGSFDPDRDGWWYPYHTSGFGNGSSLQLDLDRDSFDFECDAIVTVYRGHDVYHEWTMHATTHVARVEHPAYYDLLGDNQKLKTIAQSLTIKGLRVPQDARKAVQMGAVSRYGEQLFALDCDAIEPIGLRGDLWVDLGSEQIKLVEVSINTLKKSSYMYETSQVAYPDEQDGVRYFIKNDSFWERAKQQGSVDIIYDPYPDRKYNGGITDNIIYRSIVWRDVPLILTTPTPIQEQQSDGTYKQVFRLSDPPTRGGGAMLTSDAIRPEPVHGELVDDDGADDQP